MKDGFQFSVSFSEFTVAAFLIAVVAVSVAYFHRAPAVVHEPAVTVTAPAVNVQVPMPKITVRVILPKQEPKPQTEMFVEPKPQDQSKVWDNDNMLRASDPPTFKRRTPIVTTALMQ